MNTSGTANMLPWADMVMASSVHTDEMQRVSALVNWCWMHLLSSCFSMRRPVLRRMQGATRLRPCSGTGARCLLPRCLRKGPHRLDGTRCSLSSASILPGRLGCSATNWNCPASQPSQPLWRLIVICQGSHWRPLPSICTQILDSKSSSKQSLRQPMLGQSACNPKPYLETTLLVLGCWWGTLAWRAILARLTSHLSTG